MIALAWILVLSVSRQGMAQLTTHEKLDEWSRGAFVFPKESWNATSDAFLRRHSYIDEPIRPVRRNVLRDCSRGDCGRGSVGWNIEDFWDARGGAQSLASYEAQFQGKLLSLAQRFGREFEEAIELNKQEHAEDCRKSCEIFYCADPAVKPKDLNNSGTQMRSYSMGAVPPEDFAEQFGFPLDLIKVSQGSPFFSAEEALEVIRTAEAEGVDKNEYRSGKYKLGGDWLDKLPNTREWFNARLETTFFPMMAHLFPEVISSPAVLRAHSVSLLKYNSTHPRTDVHIDNGILALTVAMTPKSDYMGGGTYFEHMGIDRVLPMDVGHATFRPGSVRHGGNRVTSGTRYILGCFLLIADKVEHVRRLKNRGSSLRRQGDLVGSAKHFEWALAINPKCTTCLKDWAEILHTEKQFSEAEEKIRLALELLEEKDSDALFTLGVLLSEQGRDGEAISAYQQSVALNAEDAELCFNLGTKFGAQGRTKDEMKMYAKATVANPSFGAAWLNWGTILAEEGDMVDAEAKFLQAVSCGGESAPKAMMNLALVYQKRGEELAMGGDLSNAKIAALKASNFADEAKPLLDHLASSSNDGDIERYLQQFRPQRLQCYRLVGQIHAGMGDLVTAENEFRRATEQFPSEAAAWQMLGRVLEVQGKTEEATKIAQTVQKLRTQGP